MSLRLRRLYRGLTSRVAETRPGADDPRLLGRTYAVPFEEVWRAALALAGGELSRWTLSEADDYEGVIRATARSAVFRRIGDVTITVGLDADAQTRVDARSVSRAGRCDLGSNARRIARFFRALDQALATRGHTLPPVPPPAVR